MLTQPGKATAQCLSQRISPIPNNVIFSLRMAPRRLPGTGCLAAAELARNLGLLLRTLCRTLLRTLGELAPLLRCPQGWLLGRGRAC